jgi:hypothetical protein
VKKLAHQVSHEPLSTQVPAAQLLDAVKSRPYQPSPLPHHQHTPLPLHELQSLTSHQSHQSVFVLMLMVANEFTVKAGLFHHNHAQSTLAALSTISEPPSVSAVTSVHNARPTNAKLLTSSTSAALSTHASHMAVILSSAHSLFQLAHTTKT